MSNSFKLGSGWMVIATLLFALMGVFVKIASANFGAVELVFWRTIVGVISLGFMAKMSSRSIYTPHWPYHLKRGCIGYTSLLLYFYAIKHLPLATAVTLNYTSPMFLALLSIVLLKERVKSYTLAVLALGFVGVVLLLQPTFAADTWFAGLLGAISGVFAGWSYLHVREIGKLGEPEWRTVFYFALISAVASFFLMLFNTWSPISWESASYLLGIGICATLAQLCLTRAYKEGNKMLAANLSYLTVVFSSIAGVLVWSDVLSTSEMLAIALIIISGILSSRKV